MSTKSNSPLAIAKRACREADRVSAGQTVCAVSGGVQFRAVQFRVRGGRLEVVDLHDIGDFSAVVTGGDVIHKWQVVDLDAHGRPLIYDESGNLLACMVATGWSAETEAKRKAALEAIPSKPEPVTLDGHALAIAKAGRSLSVLLTCNMEHFHPEIQAEAKKRVAAFLATLEPVAPF